LSKLVQLDDARAELRTLGHIFLLQARHGVVHAGELARCLVGRGGRLLQLRDFDLARDLERAEIPEKGVLVRRETIGFLLQRAEAVGGAARERLCAIVRAGGSRGLLRGKRRDDSLLREKRSRNRRERGRERKAFHGCQERENYNIWIVRALGIDVGRRRIGLAISDATGTLATPLKTIAVESGSGVDLVASEIDRIAGEDDGLARIVVGLPVRLDGTANEQTSHVADFVTALRRRTPIEIVTADERLTSREAESRLAVGERDWKKRKARLDAAAAAIILQDYLDHA